MKFTRQELDEILAMIRQVAQAEILPRFGRLAPADLRTKSGPLDPVTVADEAAEAAITDWLRVRYPHALVLGEEGCARDPAALDLWRQAPVAFVLDPIDGTANYAAGVPLFATMLAVVVAGETVAALIHEPLTGDTLLAVRGGGAVLSDRHGGERRARVSDRRDPAEMTGKAGWRYLPRPLDARVRGGLSAVAQSWDYRCAAYEYRSLVTGTVDFLLYGRTMPWDHLAGTLLLQEAGGHAAHFDATPYAGALDGGLLCAPDPRSWAALHRVLLA